MADEQREPWQPGPLVTWGLLAAGTFLLHALLLPGLRGTLSGLSSAIDALASLDALLTQLLFVVGVLLAVHLETSLLRSAASWPLKVASVPLTAVFVTLLMNASVAELAPLALLMVSATAALLALACGAAGLLRAQAPHSSAGTFLLAAGVATLLLTGARLTDLMSTLAEPRLVGWSTWLATGAWTTSGALTVVGLRHLARASRRPLLPLLAIVGLAALLTAMGTRPPTFEDTTWQVFASRSLRGLLGGSTPLLPLPLIALEQLLGVGAALWAFMHRGLPRPERIVVGLCLLSLRAPDRPLLALSLVIAALCAAAVGRSWPSPFTAR